VEKNKLYYGDNLEVLRQHVKDESVDLIYLDPPFNSRQDYNVLFAEKDGTRSSSQIMAFEDTWEWNVDAERAYEEIVERGGRVSEAMRAFRIRRRSPRPSSNASSRRVPTRATLSSTLSAGVAPQSLSLNASTAAGSGSTLPTSLSV
jgi:hypothetical protein